MPFFLLAMVVSSLQFQQGEAWIDKGFFHGLEPGDRGLVYYVLEVNDRQIRVEATWGVVESCEDSRCQLDLRDSLTPSEGYYFEIDLPESRTSIERLARIARERLEAGDLSGGGEALAQLRDRGSEGSRLAATITGEMEAERELRAREETTRNLVAQAQQALAGPDLEATRSLLSQLRRIEASEEDVAGIESRYRELLEQRMIRLEAGSYSVGLSESEADYYNQTPQFRTSLDSFWIDRWPVTEAEFSSSSELLGSGGTPQTSVTYEQARTHCSALGKRLPTELEWEVAAASSEFELGRVSEWTRSWYQAYPGNSRPEAEFGETYRVLRGERGQSRDARQSRFFMAPADRQDDVGFRCVMR